MSGERELLQAVLEALTVPYGDADYAHRLEERAAWTRTSIKGALEEGDVAWHADYLRRKLRDEEAGK